MLTFNATEHNFSDSHVTDITVIGHKLLMMQDDKYVGYMDLNDVERCYRHANHVGILSFVSKLIEEILPNSDNWGDGEQDYETAVASNNFGWRLLSAYNIQYLDLLVLDSNYLVRVAVTEVINKLKEDGVEMGDLEWMDALIDDESHWVRQGLAQIGVDRHIKVLVNDANEKVAKIAISKASPELLSELVKSDDPTVRFMALGNPNITQEQLEKLEYDSDKQVRLAVPSTGYTSDNLLDSSNKEIRILVAAFGDFDKIGKLIYDEEAEVRERIANRGIGHDVLYKDPVYWVRLTVAYNANKMILERMKSDENNRVLDAVNERLRETA